VRIPQESLQNQSFKKSPPPDDFNDWFDVSQLVVPQKAPVQVT